MKSLRFTRVVGGLSSWFGQFSTHVVYLSFRDILCAWDLITRIRMITGNRGKKCRFSRGLLVDNALALS